MQPTSPYRPACPGCGEPIGTYEPIWRVAPHIGAELTSWLRLPSGLVDVGQLWHVACAEAEGVDGG